MEEKKKRTTKIRTKMLLLILPVIIIAMLLLTVISAVTSSNSINEQISNYMNAELQANQSSIENYMTVVTNTATNLSRVVGTTYKTTDLALYEEMLSSVIDDNPLVLGSGIWFEPYAYDSNEKYVGPYIYKDGDTNVVTYDYSNASYDYFNQEYYTLAQNGTTDAIITDPYYDETLGVTMSSCTMPIFDTNDTFIGVLTVDMELTAIQDTVAAIEVGEQGSAMLLSQEGIYMSSDDTSKVENAVNATEDENASLASAAKIILAADSGMTTYETKDETYNLYYKTIPETGWKMIIQMPQSELNQQVEALVQLLVIVSIIAVILCILAVFIQVQRIAKRLGNVQSFASKLAIGDFTVDRLDVKSRDELGQMSESLNEMYDSNKDVITNISTHAISINSSSETLSDSSSELQTQFGNIKQYMGDVNESMMTASAATEELNASAEEVQSSVNILGDVINESSKMGSEISSRASVIEKESQEAFEYSTSLSAQYEENLARSVENAKVVNMISEMADVISGIAEQINLLSLNASIEAARAGEQGKGFAVVASEVGKLAGETSEAVGNIQNTIKNVQQAFSTLTIDSQSLLSFLNETVTPDYIKFVNVAKQYGTDAVSIAEISSRVSEMSIHIECIMKEMGDAVQGIAETSQETADNSSRILSAVDDVTNVVDNVSSMSNGQKEIATELNQVVNKFILTK